MQRARESTHYKDTQTPIELPRALTWDQLHRVSVIIYEDLRGKDGLDISTVNEVMSDVFQISPTFTALKSDVLRRPCYHASVVCIRLNSEAVVSFSYLNKLKSLIGQGKTFVVVVCMWW